MGDYLIFDMNVSQLNPEEYDLLNSNMHEVRDRMMGKYRIRRAREEERTNPGHRSRTASHNNLISHISKLPVRGLEVKFVSNECMPQYSHGQLGVLRQRSFRRVPPRGGCQCFPPRIGED